MFPSSTDKPAGLVSLPPPNPPCVFSPFPGSHIGLLPAPHSHPLFIPESLCPPCHFPLLLAKSQLNRLLGRACDPPDPRTDPITPWSEPPMLTAQVNYVDCYCLYCLILSELPRCSSGPSLSWCLLSLPSAWHMASTQLVFIEKMIKSIISLDMRVGQEKVTVTHCSLSEFSITERRHQGQVGEQVLGPHDILVPLAPRKPDFSTVRGEDGIAENNSSQTLTCTKHPWAQGKCCLL